MGERLVGERHGASGIDAVPVIGGGLAGCEAAWQLALRGVPVVLHEMRPVVTTPAHRSDRLAELVCSNTFKSTDVTNAHGLLKAELRLLGSLVLAVADESRVPGGTALAVDRELFAESVTGRITGHPLITVARGEVTALPAVGVIATGPLTSDALALVIRARLGVDQLAFHDAIAPVVDGESIDRTVAFRASRYGKETMEGAGADGEGGAYLNCPFTREEYDAFIDALIEADRYEGHDFDQVPYFEGCLPIEEMARRGRDVLRFGPLKPVGLEDPRTGRRPYAVAQLRMEDRAGRMWNLVGFQTRMRTGEQQRLLRMIPGLGQTEILRYGSIHRNSYVNAPAALSRHLAVRDQATLLFAGQITGVEGYTESCATGLLAGINLARLLDGRDAVVPPATTMLGALYRYLQEADPTSFQPMNANFGLLEDLASPVRDKQRKRELFAERSLAVLAEWCREVGVRARPLGAAAAAG